MNTIRERPEICMEKWKKNVRQNREGLKNAVEKVS